MTMVNKPLKQRWRRATDYNTLLPCIFWIFLHISGSHGCVEKIEEHVIVCVLCFSNLIFYGLHSVPSFPFLFFFASRASAELTGY